LKGLTALLALLILPPSLLFAKGKVYISADMEGIAGVVTGEQLGPQGFEYPRFREFMTNEVLAAIEGARAAGATEILARLEHARPHAQAIAQAMQLVEAREACTNDEGVEMHRYCSRITEPKSSPGATSPCSPSSIVTRRSRPVKRNGCA